MNVVKSIRLMLKIRATEKLIRLRMSDAEHYRDTANIINGEIIPMLSLKLANLRLEQRQLHEPARQVLGQVKPLRQVA